MYVYSKIGKKAISRFFELFADDKKLLVGALVRMWVAERLEQQ